MNVKLIALCLLSCAGQVFGQVKDFKFKKEIDSLSIKYKESVDKINQLTTDFNDLSKQLTINFSDDLNGKIKTKQEQIRNEKEKFKSIYQLIASYKSVTENIKTDANTIETQFAFFKDDDKKLLPETAPEDTDTKVYVYFGENKIIDESILKSGSKEAKILNEVLTQKGEKNYLGDITIPKDNQKIDLYKFYKLHTIKKIRRLTKEKNSLFAIPGITNTEAIKTVDAELDKIIARKKMSFHEQDYASNKIFQNVPYVETGKTLKFKKLGIEIKDGYFYDIVAYMEDEVGNTHVFTNQVGLSILFYDQYGSKRYMYYKYSLKKNKSQYTDNDLTGLYLKVTDILGYSYKVGHHFIPQDLAIELPKNDTENKETNRTANATYQIKQETDLEKIVELRAYTDFLALFGKSNNGLAQIEGKAKFYLFPYPFRLFWSKRILGQVEYLPSISPYVNYSRFDDKSKFIDLSTINDQPGNKNFEMVEKRYLTMGLHLEVLKWQHKDAPICFSLYGILDYNLSQTNTGTDEAPVAENIKSLNYGYGINLGVKRFNNFGFDYKFEATRFDFKDFNGSSSFSSLPSSIPAIKNGAEIFYYPNGNPNQAIFTRLITYNYLGRENNQAFFQFQFGYKFAVGNRTVNK